MSGPIEIGGSKVSTSSVWNAVKTDPPVQGAGTGSIFEWKNSRELTLDYQKGVIVHVYDIPGNPPEALIDQRMDGQRPGDIHPWAGIQGYNSRFDYHYLVRQSLKHLVRGDANERYTRVTSVYEQTPCPGAYEQTVRTVVRPVLEWYPRRPRQGDTEWTSITGGMQAVPVPAPRPVIMRKYKRVKMLLSEVMALASDVGKLGSVEDSLGGFSGDNWLFEGLEARMLYGAYHRVGGSTREEDFDPAFWEITTFAEADIRRKHATWFPKVDKSFNLPIRLPIDRPRDELHEIWDIFDRLPASRKISDLLRGAFPDSNCEIPDGE